MLTRILTNWTTQFTQHINDQFKTNKTGRITMVTKQEPTEKREPDVIEVDSVEPSTPGNVLRVLRKKLTYICVMAGE